MARWIYFYNLTNLFFSILPNEYEARLDREIWGCVKYIGIPYETVMRMPIYKRKNFIRMHNEEQEGIKQKEEAANNKNKVNGELINNFAKMEQANQINREKNR